MRSRGCNRTWHGIPKGSEHTAPGDPAAKRWGKPLNIELTNVEKIFFVNIKLRGVKLKRGLGGCVKVEKGGPDTLSFKVGSCRLFYSV